MRLFFLAFILSISARATTFTFTVPLDRQIVQRDGVNTGTIVISGPNTTGGITATAQATPIATYPGTTTALTNLTITGGVIMGNVYALAGWYSLAVKVYDATPTLLSTTTLNHVGVGDVFVTAGQSNAANYYQPLNSTPPDDRVNSRGTLSANPWALATDPQPAPVDQTFSSVWPALGNALVTGTTFPVGFLSVAQGGTTVANWLPGGIYYPRIKAALAYFPPFGIRAILWHQGEQDAAIGTTQASYTASIETIIDQSRLDAGWEVPWGIAHVSHPNEATGLGVVAAQDAVGSTYPYCWQGPNTDSLGNTYRGADFTHFNTTTGQNAHAGLWSTIILGQMLTNSYVPMVIDTAHSKLCFFNSSWLCVQGI